MIARESPTHVRNTDPSDLKGTLPKQEDCGCMLFAILTSLLASPLVALYYYCEYHKLTRVANKLLNWCADKQQKYHQLLDTVHQLQEEKIDRLKYLDSLESQLSREQGAYQAYANTVENRHEEDQKAIREAYIQVIRSTREHFITYKAACGDTSPLTDENNVD